MENDEHKIPILLQTQTEMVSLLQKTNFPYPVRRKKGKEFPRKTVIKDNQVFRLFTVPSPSNQALTGQGHIPVIQ